MTEGVRQGFFLGGGGCALKHEQDCVSKRSRKHQPVGARKPQLFSMGQRERREREGEKGEKEMYAGHHYELGKITRLQQSCEAISGRRERFYPKKFIFSGSQNDWFQKVYN